MKCLGWLAVGCLALAACGNVPEPSSRAPAVSVQAVRAAAAGGYQSGRNLPTTSVATEWPTPRGLVELTLVAPVSGGPYPLVVYLPGLGESSAGGAVWRAAWAAAGYAVASLQQQALGESIWRTPRARSGDFRGLAREQFAPATLAARLADVRGAIDEIARRGAAGIAPYALVDTRQVVIAGFDLGAQTALAAAGERHPRIALEPIGPALRGVIALSPYADPGPGDVANRFGAIRMPVLAVTSNDDLDPYGLIESASTRRVPWQSMPAGDKYALMLHRASHALISGSSLTAIAGPLVRGTGPIRERPEPIDVDPRRRGPQPTARVALPPATLGFDPEHFAAVQSTSIAFLDLVLRAAPAAREWLARDAAAFLANAGTLEAK